MPLHPAWAKNIARRVLWGALEKDISSAERKELSEYFDGKCAYCSESLPARWHADHVVSIDQGGFHHKSNRVPSCPKCNEHEKREMDWKEFLIKKCADDNREAQERIDKIQSWLDHAKPEIPTVTEEQRAIWKEEAATVSKAIDQAWQRLRST